MHEISSLFALNRENVFFRFRITNQMLGFSRIFKDMIKAKKVNLYMHNTRNLINCLSIIIFYFVNIDPVYSLINVSCKFDILRYYKLHRTSGDVIEY